MIVTVLVLVWLICLAVLRSKGTFLEPQWKSSLLKRIFTNMEIWEKLYKLANHYMHGNYELAKLELKVVVKIKEIKDVAPFLYSPRRSWSFWQGQTIFICHWNKRENDKFRRLHCLRFLVAMYINTNYMCMSLIAATIRTITDLFYYKWRT